MSSPSTVSARATRWVSSATTATSGSRRSGLRGSCAGPRQRQLPLRRGRAALLVRQRRHGRAGPRGAVLAANRRGSGGLPTARGVRGVRRRLRRGHLGLRRTRLRDRARCGITGARLRAAQQRRPVHALHRRHHRHAQGRHVAPRGLLLGHGRPHAERAGPADRATRRAPRARRREPSPGGAPAGSAHARRRAVVVHPERSQRQSDGPRARRTTWTPPRCGASLPPRVSRS